MANEAHVRGDERDKGRFAGPLRCFREGGGGRFREKSVFLPKIEKISDLWKNR